MKKQSSALGTGETVLQIVAVELKTLGCLATQFDEDAKNRLEYFEFRHLKPGSTGGISAVPPDKSGSHSFKLKLGPGASQHRPFELCRVGGGRSVSVDSGSTMFIIGPSESGVYEITAESSDHGTRFEWLFKCKLGEDSITDLSIKGDVALPSEAKVQPGYPPSTATPLATALSVSSPIATSTTATGENNKPKAQPNERSPGKMTENALVRWLADEFCKETEVTRQTLESGLRGSATSVRWGTVYIARGLGLKSAQIASVKGMPIPGNVSMVYAKAAKEYGTGVSNFANIVKKVKVGIPKSLLPNEGEGTATEAGAGTSSPTSPASEKPKRRSYVRRATKAKEASLIKSVSVGHGNDSVVRPDRDLLIFLVGQSNGCTTADLTEMFGVTDAEVERAFGHFALKARDLDSKIPKLTALFQEVVGQ